MPFCSVGEENRFSLYHSEFLVKHRLTREKQFINTMLHVYTGNNQEKKGGGGKLSEMDQATTLNTILS